MPVDVRLSILPTYYGENAVLRLLSSHTASFTLEDLGMSKLVEKSVANAVEHSHGLILVTGPTGSGKTTTLYALMRLLSEQSLSLVTLEDPVEYCLPGVRQIPVREQGGISFAQGLRSVLRQDPDVIMVGEIRDAETASLAVQAALTGHLVLSTLHTSTAAEALPRLMDMGVAPYLAASTVRLVIGQRLVLQTLGEHGQSQRTGVFEALAMTEEVEDAVLRKSTAREIRKFVLRDALS